MEGGLQDRLATAYNLGDDVDFGNSFQLLDQADMIFAAFGGHLDAVPKKTPATVPEIRKQLQFRLKHFARLLAHGIIDADEWKQQFHDHLRWGQFALLQLGDAKTTAQAEEIGELLANFEQAEVVLGPALRARFAAGPDDDELVDDDLVPEPGDSDSDGGFNTEEALQ